MRTTQTRIPAALLILLALTAGCDEDDITAPSTTTYEASEPISFDLPVTTQTAVSLSNINGSIEIVGVRATSPLTVRGEKYVRSDSQDDAEARLDSVQVLVETTDAMITIRTSQPVDRRQYGVDYVLEVPQGMDMHLTATNGLVDARDLNGDLEIRLANGGIAVAGAGGNLDLGVVNGEISAAVTLPSAGRANLAVVNGGIALAIPRETSADFEALVTAGSITVKDLDFTDEVVTPHAYRGTLGAGDGSIELIVNIGAIAVAGT